MTRPMASNAIPEGRELNRRVEVKGEFSESTRPVILDRHRVEPSVRINRLPATVDELGRFSRTLTEKVERIEIEMGDSQGRSVQTSLLLPNMVIIEPAGGEVRVASNPSGPAASGELIISYRFVGRTTPGSTLTLNGKPLPLAADGAFSFTLDLGEGVVDYWLMARNPEGYGKHFKLNISIDSEKETALRNAKTGLKP